MNPIHASSARTARAFALLAALAMALGARAAVSGEPWRAPDEELGRANPIPSTPQSIEAGRALYLQNCQGCHGPEGRGDGPTTRHVKMTPGDLTLHAAGRGATDGELHWKIATGRPPMGPYSPHLDDSDIWNLVNFIRALNPAAIRNVAMIEFQRGRGGERLVGAPPPARRSRRSIWLMLFGSIFFTGAIFSIMMDRGDRARFAGS